MTEAAINEVGPPGQVCRWRLRAGALAAGTLLSLVGLAVDLPSIVFAGYGLVAGSLASGAI